MRRVGEKPYHHGDLRSTLLESALRLIEVRRRTDFSLRDLADGIGVTQPALYRHFKSKTDLLVTICVDGFRIFAQLEQDALRAAGSDSWNRLIALVRSYIRFASTHPGYFRVMFESGAANQPRVTPVVLPTFTIVVEAVEAGQRDGHVIAGSPWDLAIAVWAAAHGMAALFLNGLLGNVLDEHMERAQRLEEAIVALVQRGLRAGRLLTSSRGGVGTAG